ASFVVELVERHQREATTDELAVELRSAVEAAIAPFSGATAAVGAASEAFVAGTSSGLAIPLSSTDYELLRERPLRAVVVHSELPELMNVGSDLADATNERVFVVDPARLDGTGLTVSDVYTALRVYNVPTEAARFRSGGLDLPIVVSTDPRAVATEQQLLSLP